MLLANITPTDFPLHFQSLDCMIVKLVWNSLLCGIINTHLLSSGLINARRKQRCNNSAALGLWVYHPCVFSFVHRADSSFNYMTFFFIFFLQCVLALIQTIGISGWGTRSVVKKKALKTVRMFHHGVGCDEGFCQMIKAAGKCVSIRHFHTWLFKYHSIHYSFLHGLGRGVVAVAVHGVERF